MIRSSILLSLAMTCCAVDNWERMDPTMGSLGFAIASTTSSNVGLGPIDKSWTEATRAEVYFRSYYPASGGMQPFFEGALFNDAQNYHNYDGKIDVDTFGLSVAFGAAVLPFEQTGRGPMSFGIMPYVRFAGGSSDVYIRDLEFEGETYEASGSVGRFDFGGGADLRVTVGRHIEAAIGGGINFWSSANIYASSTSNGGTVVIGKSVDFSGHDTFLRASAGFSF